MIDQVRGDAGPRLPHDDHPVPDRSAGNKPPRIRPLGETLADQIAAGEVVERPASVVKELLENAIDADAHRVQIELTAAGVESIAVIDDGYGIHPEDLPLALTRHATSKLRCSEDLEEIATLGFRGEALASMAAVAQVRIRSRPRGSDRGLEIVCRPGLSPESSPVGMPEGTKVELRGLFANVPARRKFLRSEATELGHVTQTVLRVALVHPEVHISLRHGSRRLLELPAASLTQRIEQVLARNRRAELERVDQTHDGIRVQAWRAPSEAATRGRGGLYVVVRRRVVREPNIAKIVTAGYGDALGHGHHPLACVIVDPPPGEVDVNVHPQKAEIRFGSPQRVYAAVRAVLGTIDGPSAPDRDPANAGFIAAQSTRRASLDGVLDRWAQAAHSVAETPGPAYRLRTQATGRGYTQTRQELRADAHVLQQAWRDDRAADSTGPVIPGPVDPGPEYLGALPGLVGLFAHEGCLLAVDLRVLRSHLVLRRLRRELGDGAEVMAQGLLEPVVVRLPASDVALCGQGAAALTHVGLHIEAFGDDAIIVRAVPASLRQCVEQPDVSDLVTRVIPWLRMQQGARPTPESLREAAQAISGAQGPDPAPRLARRWIRELLLEGQDLEQIPGLRRWTAAALVGQGSTDGG